MRHAEEMYFAASFESCADGACSSVPALSYVILPSGY